MVAIWLIAGLLAAICVLYFESGVLRKRGVSQKNRQISLIITGVIMILVWAAWSLISV